VVGIDRDRRTGAINGTPDTPDDDFVDFNPPAEQICFPIGFPQGGTN